jgi:FKBP-type peptidyl-prolyl cis-trans isomerase FkpA
MKKIFSVTLFVLLLFQINNCKKIDYEVVDNDIIQQYISDNNLNAESTESGLYYVIDVPGTGENPTVSSNVTVAYTGSLTDGSIFDQSNSNGITFPLSGVIQGWQEGIPLFKEGGSGILLIPSALGYGSQAVSSIPANSVLIFDVNLIDVD